MSPMISSNPAHTHTLFTSALMQLQETEDEMSSSTTASSTTVTEASDDERDPFELDDDPDPAEEILSQQSDIEADAFGDESDPLEAMNASHQSDNELELSYMGNGGADLSDTDIAWCPQAYRRRIRPIFRPIYEDTSARGSMREHYDTLFEARHVQMEEGLDAADYCAESELFEHEKDLDAYVQSLVALYEFQRPLSEQDIHEAEELDEFARSASEEILIAHEHAEKDFEHIISTAEKNGIFDKVSDCEHDQLKRFFGSLTCRVCAHSLFYHDDTLCKGPTLEASLMEEVQAVENSEKIYGYDSEEESAHLLHLERTQGSRSRNVENSGRHHVLPPTEAHNTTTLYNTVQMSNRQNSIENLSDTSSCTLSDHMPRYPHGSSTACPDTPSTLDSTLIEEQIEENLLINEALEFDHMNAQMEAQSWFEQQELLEIELLQAKFEYHVRVVALEVALENMRQERLEASKRKAPLLEASSDGESGSETPLMKHMKKEDHHETSLFFTLPSATRRRMSLIQPLQPHATLPGASRDTLISQGISTTVASTYEGKGNALYQKSENLSMESISRSEYHLSPACGISLAVTLQSNPVATVNSTAYSQKAVVTPESQASEPCLIESEAGQDDSYDDNTDDEMRTEETDSHGMEWEVILTDADI